MKDQDENATLTKAEETKITLSSIALFLGEIRDGITM